MNTNIKLMDLKGCKTPDFSEPKGDQYHKAMEEIRQKVEGKRKIKRDSEVNIQEYKDQLVSIKHQIIMAEDEHEEFTLKARRKQIQEELENIDDYSGLDINAYARKLINKKEINELQKEARKEHTEILNTSRPYVHKLEEQARLARKLLNQFEAALGSESSFRQAQSRYNSFKNN